MTSDLVPCADCGRALSREAFTCPGCGRPMRRPPQGAFLTAMNGLTLLVLLVIVSIPLLGGALALAQWAFEALNAH